MTSVKSGAGLLLLAAASSVCCFGQSDTTERTWVGTWAAAPSAIPRREVGYRAKTIREIVHVSTAGRFIRVKISNELGTGPLTIGRASIALRENEDQLKETPVALNFDGNQEVTIPAGNSITSDVARLDAPALSDVAVSLFIPQQEMKVLTVHWFGNTTSYVAPGDQVMTVAMANPAEYLQWPFLTSLDVRMLVDDNSGGVESFSKGRDVPAGAVVCLGDSITAGFHSTLNANDSWPDELAVRLQANESLKHVGVLNEGIPSNRALHDGDPKAGPSALSRFDRDVLGQSDARYLIILEGINDIGEGYGPKNPGHSDAPTAQDLESAYKEMAAKARAKGMKVIGGTLTPYGNASYYSEEGEAVRQEVNTWIRTTALATHIYEGVIDFDRVLRAAKGGVPEILNPIYDSGDHLHPNDAGYKAMGKAIELEWFSR